MKEWKIGEVREIEGFRLINSDDYAKDRCMSCFFNRTGRNINSELKYCKKCVSLQRRVYIKEVKDV